VQWAIYDKDPVPVFKAQIQKLHWIYLEQLKGATTEAAKADSRSRWIAARWDGGFREITGDRLYLLTSDSPHPFESNAPDGKKWIVTKVRMTKGKPVCWCIPVEVKYGEETKVMLTEKNVFDLGSAADTAMKDAPALSANNKRIEEWARKTWRIRLGLRFPGASPFEVSYALFDEDPAPGFKASVKKWQSSIRKGDRPESEVKEEDRKAAMTVNWDGIFKKIPGNRLYQLRSSGSPVLASNEPGGKKWLVTKVVDLKGKPVCWCVPVEVKTGQEIKVTLNKDNVYDLGSAFDDALRESESKK
jgi:hypothetical protein